MKDEANDFLKKSGELYELNKRKWRKILKEKGLEFSEDIYNDSILKTYDAILKKETDILNCVGYWFQSFLNNTKRDEKYARNQIVEDEDVFDILKDKEYEEEKNNNYYSTLSDILLIIYNKFDRKTFETFRLHLLCNMSYEQIDALTGLKDSKYRITKVKRFINDNRQIFNS